MTMNTEVRNFTQSWLSGASPRAVYPVFHSDLAIPGVSMKELAKVREVVT